MSQREKMLKVPKSTIDKWVLKMHHKGVAISTLHSDCFINSRVTVHNAINHGIATQTTIDKITNYLNSLK
jgi:hypothetical protein